MENFVTFQIEKEQAVSKKFFVYRNKKYPFNFDLIKQNSIYFNDNQQIYQNVNEIHLLGDNEEEYINISDDAIGNFISLCQNEECKINISNLIDLQYLSLKFGVTRLTTMINKYFTEHLDNQALNSLLFKLQLSARNNNQDTEKWKEQFYDTSKEEKFIGTNLNKYIDQEKLLLLPFSTIYRILSIQTKNAQTVQTNKFIDFLFKCLDKYGKEASILFSQIDFKQQKIEVIDKLIREYKENFDFNMINSTLSETTIELTSELRKLKEEFDKSLSEMKFLFNKQKEELKQIKIEEEKQSKERKILLQKEIESLQNESKKAKEIFQQEIESLRVNSKKTKEILKQEIETFQNESKKSKEIFQQEIESLKDENKKAKEILQREIKTLQDENNKSKEILKQEIETFQNDSKKSKEIFQQEIEKSISNVKTLLENHKEELKQINIEEKKQSEERKKYIQQETERIKNDIAKPKEIFQQQINKLVDEMEKTVKKFKEEEGKVDISIIKSIVDPKFFINLNDDMKKRLIKEILLDLSNNNENPKREYKGLIKQVFLLHNFYEILNNSNNEDDEIYFIQRNINNVVFDSKMIENLFRRDLLLPSIINLIDDFDSISFEMILKFSLENFRPNELTKFVNINEGVSLIEKNAFERCVSLIQISIPSSVTYIGEYAFNRCKSLKQISIPSSVTEIGDSAFEECSLLKQITIPSSVTKIGNYTFIGCSSLAQIAIPSSITEIGEYAFFGCSSLKQITIENPSSLISIGDYAFKNCSSLTQITIPSSVTSIGKCAFKNCSSLTQISIPSSVTETGRCAFKKCSSLTQISIPIHIDTSNLCIPSSAKLSNI